MTEVVETSTPFWVIACPASVMSPCWAKISPLLPTPPLPLTELVPAGDGRREARVDARGFWQVHRAAAETRQTELDIQRLRLGAERREEAETELRDLGYRELELAERRRALTEQVARLEDRKSVV